MNSRRHVLSARALLPAMLMLLTLATTPACAPAAPAEPEGHIDPADAALVVRFEPYGWGGLGVFWEFRATQDGRIEVIQDESANGREGRFHGRLLRSPERLFAELEASGFFASDIATIQADIEATGRSQGAGHADRHVIDIRRPDGDFHIEFMRLADLAPQFPDVASLQTFAEGVERIRAYMHHELKTPACESGPP